MLAINASEKQAVLDYLRNGEELAIASGYPKNRKNGEVIQVEWISYTDGIDEWTTEDIINFDLNSDVFNESLIRRILLA